MKATTNTTQPATINFPDAEPNIDRIRRDATSLFKIRWSNLKIAKHFASNNQDCTYGRYITEDALLPIVNALLDELNAQVRKDNAEIARIWRDVAKQFPKCVISGLLK